MEVREVYALKPANGEKVSYYPSSREKNAAADIVREIDSATVFFAVVKGDSLTDMGARDGDILAFDSKIEPRDKDIIATLYKDEITIKVYRYIDGVEYFQTANSQFLPLSLPPFDEYKILGVAIKAIQNLRR